MAQVAAIYSLPLWRRTIADVLHGLHDAKERDAKQPRPINKRVWASIEHGAQQVVDDAFAERLRRDPERKRRWVVLVDGQQDQIKRVQRGARKAGVDHDPARHRPRARIPVACGLRLSPESSPEAEK